MERSLKLRLYCGICVMLLGILVMTGCSAAGREAEQAAGQTRPLTVDREAQGWLPAGIASQVADAALPVLVPRDRSLVSVAHVVVQPAFYSLSSSTEGATISLHGTNVLRQYPDFPKIDRPFKVRGMPALIRENEGIRSVTWIENRASYVVDVECAASADRRCASNDYVISLAERLTYVGGAAPARPPK